MGWILNMFWDWERVGGAACGGKCILDKMGNGTNISFQIVLYDIRVVKVI